MAIYLKAINISRGLFAVVLFMALLMISPFMHAQEFTNSNINEVDDQGRKQGDWKTYDVNGSLKFKGSFVDGIPVGTFFFYYPEGKIKARSEMYDNGRRSRTKTFHSNGRLMAEGNYLNKKKDSSWSYYSDFDGVLLSAEFYANGEHEGIVYNYYPSGAVNEEIPYKNGVKQGEWKRYFTDGNLKLTAKYIDGKLEGLMLIYFQNGVPEVSGMYVNNFKDGLWLYFNPRGETLKKETFERGHLRKTEDKQTK
jgi:antitoxin component YwqK of YwqJK toxin-antitoxin module